MIQRGTKEEIFAYLCSTALNQSFLKKVVLRGRSTSLERSTQLTGDFVDMALTLPDHVEEFYTVYTGETPSGPMEKMLLNCIEYLIEKRRLTPDIKQHREAILKQCEFDEYCPKAKPDTKFQNIVAKGAYWWQFVVESSGKIVISDNEMSFGMGIVDQTKIHPVTAPYFPDASPPGRDFYYQIPIYFTVEGQACKGLPDIVVVSHTRKEIHLVDIKTIWETSRTTMFDQIRTNRYIFQSSFYAEALRQKFKDLIAQGYTVECKIMFIPKNRKVFNPEIIPVTQKMLDWEKFGGRITGRTYENEAPSFLYRSNFPIKGWLDAVRIYQTAVRNNLQAFNLQVNAPITGAEAETLFFV